MKTPQLLFLALLVLLPSIQNAQISSAELGGAQLNAIKTAVQFLTIAPDARSGGMGDAGVAGMPDENSQHWNVAKYPFLDSRFGVSSTYTPWLRNLIPDINLFYTSGFYKINPRHVLSASVRYFDLGEIIFPSGPFHPFEYAADIGYSIRLGDHLSSGIAFRYIYSDLASGAYKDTRPGTSFAGDLGIYYENSFPIAGPRAEWALGLLLSNLGPGLNYSDDADKIPIPSKLSMGGRFGILFNEQHSLHMHSEVYKLLVPTPPVLATDTLSGEQVVIRGMEAPESIVSGMFQSFYDAPGVLTGSGEYSVLREELNEIALSVGVEYLWRNRFALRYGYFHEHASKGNRKFFTLGLGMQFGDFRFDLSYLIPANGPNSPLANTFRIMLSYSFREVS